MNRQEFWQAVKNDWEDIKEWLLGMLVLLIVLFTGGVALVVLFHIIKVLWAMA